jgi:histone-lysine N-methyltransferase SETMAR
MHVVLLFHEEWILKAVKLSPQKTVISAWYTQECLPPVLQSVEQRRPKSGLRGICIHHDNASPRTAATTAYLQEKDIAIIPHPPYSPDLAPNDFFFISKVKESLRDHHFENDTELEEAVHSALIQFLMLLTGRLLITGLFACSVV